MRRPVEISRGSRFDLENAIDTWRHQFKYHGMFLPEDVIELERHLRDCIETGRARGLQDEEAFQEAVRTVGDVHGATLEYSKVYWGKVIRRRGVREELRLRTSMLIHHLKPAVRSVKRYPAYFFMNGVGLAVGIACSLVIGLYVLEEASFDRFHENADQIFRVNGISRNPEGDFYRTMSPAPLASALVESYPDVEAAVRLAPLQPQLVKAGDLHAVEDASYLTESSFFDVFSFELLAGDPRSAFASPGNVVLTASTARRYFGDANPLDRVVTVQDSVALTVAGIVADPPSNSHLRFSLLASLQTPGLQADGWLDDWDRSSSFTYVLLRPGASSDTIEAMLPRVVETHLAGILDDDEKFTLSLQPIAAIRFHPHVAPERVRASSPLQYVYLLSAIGLFVLLISSVNYVNLAISTSFRRTREVGVRKVLGSHPKQLAAQFLGESLLTTGIAIIAACAAVAALLPALDGLIGKTYTVGLLGDARVVLGTAALWILVGVGTGVYPAFYLSTLRPVAAIRGLRKDRATGRGPLRNGLLVVQFVAAIILVIGTLVVIRQLDFVRQRDLGYNEEHVVLITVRDPNVWSNAAALKDELGTIPGVHSTSLSSGVPNDVGRQSTAGFERDGQAAELEVGHIMVDYDFLDVFEMKIVEGRFFSEAHPGDETAAYVLNEAAVRAIGWEDPVGKSFTLWGNEAPVVGVVRDFNFESLHRPIGPLALHFGPRWYSTVSLRIAPENVTTIVAAIRTTMQKFSPDRPVEYAFLDDTFDEMYRAERRFASVSSVLTILALMLAVLGLVGLTALSVEHRIKEIGIRKALGASALSIVALLSKGLVRLILIAFAAGVPIAYIVMKWWLDDFAYRIDLGVGLFVLSGAALMLVALATVSLRSFRAAAADPVCSLRYE